MIEIKGATVFRDDEAIGSIQGDTCVLRENVGPAIKGQIRTTAKNPNLSFEVGAVEEKQPEEAIKDIKNGKLLVGLERLLHAAKEGRIPPAPEQHPGMGDKDPAFVAWFKAYATEDEFNRQYGGRKMPANMAEWEAAESKRFAKLAGEKTDSGKD